MSKTKGWRVRILISIFFASAIISGSVVGVQYATKTGLFYIPGVVVYDNILDPDARTALEPIFTEDIKIDADVHISSNYSLEKPQESDTEFLYKILVPVTDFYSETTNVDFSSAEEALRVVGYPIFLESSPESDNSSDSESQNSPQNLDLNFQFLNVENLKHNVKLLKLNNKYYLDEFDTGAIYITIKFESEKFSEEIAPLIASKFDKIWPEKSTVLTFAQTGVTALSRGMHTKLKQVGDARFFAEYIGEYLSGFDITHTSNESSFTNYAYDRNICSDPSFIDTLLAIGLDIVELTGNHNQDCGDAAALNTIDTYKEHGIKIVGGGKTADEAAIPLNITEKNSNITFFAYNLSTGGATYDNTPGANQYYEDSAAADIAAAKQRGDFVVVDIQYYECNSYASTYEDPICDRADSAAGDQIGFFRHLIDLGADLVVGTSAHQPQTYELYGNGVIYYGLGNLFFDQIWWPGTTRSLILSHYFYNNKLLQTKIVPTVYGDDMRTKLLDEETSTWFLNRLKSVRP